MKSRVCFVFKNYNYGGGTERVVSQIANGLIEKDYDVSIVSLGKGTNPHFDTDNRIKLYELDSFNSGKKQIKVPLIRQFATVIRVIKRTLKLKKVLKPIAPDFIIAVDIVLYFYINFIIKSSNVKKIGWEHYCLEEHNNNYLKLSRYLATKNASKIIVLSDGDLKAYQTKYPKATNLQRIYNPIAFESTNNIDVRNKVVVAAGRYVPEKGFDMLIDSWSKIYDKCSDWELRIFGEGVEREHLQAQIDTLNLQNVKLCGYAKELDKEFEKASIFALSSRLEGWGLVLTEAQAKGLPCVSFNCKKGPAEIVDNEVNGFLVPPNDTDAFAEKLLELMQNEELRRSFSANAHKDLYRFEPEKVVNEWVELFESLSRE